MLFKWAVVPEIKADWWGHKQGFTFGGLLGARSNKLCKARSSDDNSAYVRKTFAEEDQENLYNLVQVPFTGLDYSDSLEMSIFVFIVHCSDANH